MEGDEIDGDEGELGKLMPPEDVLPDVESEVAVVGQQERVAITRNRNRKKASLSDQHIEKATTRTALREILNGPSHRSDQKGRCDDIRLSACDPMPNIRDAIGTEARKEEEEGREGEEV